MSLQVIGPTLPKGYFVTETRTANGVIYRPQRTGWLGNTHRHVAGAIEEAYEHFYQVSGAKPILVYRPRGEGCYTDILTGLHVSREQVASVRTFAQAFRYKSSKFLALADTCTYDRLHDMLMRSAARYEEVAQRLEVERNG